MNDNNVVTYVEGNKPDMLNNLNGYREDSSSGSAHMEKIKNMEHGNSKIDASTSCSDLEKMDLSTYIEEEIVDETPRIISIDGNIGSGKSTLYKRLQEYYKDRSDICFVPEPVDIWSTIKDDKDVPILTNLYKDTKKYAFRFQMMAYISRLNLLRNRLMERKHKIIISERCVQTDKHVFAQMLYDDNMIEHDEFIIYNKWFNEFLGDINMFGIIYVKATPEICYERVIKRGREGEVIPLEYLQKCHEYHEKWLSYNSDNIHKIDADTNITDTENTDVLQLWLTNIHGWIDRTISKMSGTVFYVDANPEIIEDKFIVSYNIRKNEEVIHSNKRLFMKQRIDIGGDNSCRHGNDVEHSSDAGEYLSIIDGLRYLTRGDTTSIHVDQCSRIIVRSKNRNVVDYINGIIPGEPHGINKSFKNVIHTSIIGYPNIQFVHVK